MELADGRAVADVTLEGANTKLKCADENVWACAQAGCSVMGIPHFRHPRHSVTGINKVGKVTVKNQKYLKAYVLS